MKKYFEPLPDEERHTPLEIDSVLAERPDSQATIIYPFPDIDSETKHEPEPDPICKEIICKFPEETFYDHAISATPGRT